MSRSEMDATADILLYGSAERALAEVADRLAKGANIADIDDVRGTVVIKSAVPGGRTEIDSSRVDWPRDIQSLEEACGISPYAEGDDSVCDPD